MMEGIYLKNELYDLINNDTGIFEFIQSGSLDGIWYWDLENPKFEWMSPKFWETLGFNPAEKKHLASEWQDIIFQEDLKLAIENFEKHCVDPNHPYDQIVRYKHKNGSTVWIRCRGLAIRDKNGKAIRMLGAHTDITDLKETEKEISRLTKEYEKVFNGTQDAMFLIKVLENGAFQYVRNNLAHQNKTGILLEQIMDKSPQELLGKEMGDRVSENYRKCVVAGKSITYEEELNLPGGDYIWLTTLTPIVEEDQVAYIVGSATDITERKRLEIELEKQANYDKLTGLPNRKLFFERLERHIVESQRDRNQFAVLFIDLDGFKGINDKYGHDMGDKVLKKVAEEIKGQVRGSDITFRWGGEEFLVFLPNTRVHYAKQIAENLRVHLFTHDINKFIRVTVSIGVAGTSPGEENVNVLIKQSDQALYLAKAKGRNKVVIWEEDSE